MYRVGIETILGLNRRGATFTVTPCIPSVWPGFHLEWRFGTSRYDITVDNAAHRSSGVARVELDGVAVDPAAIPLSDDGKSHAVLVVMGSAAPATSRWSPPVRTTAIADRPN
jgi:cyclic beta-1,2-glucan synthetase